MLYVSNLKKRYADVTALDGVSFGIDQPGLVAVIGRSGAGKSTLLRMINRLDQPTSGEIMFEGENILSLSGRGSATLASLGGNGLSRLQPGPEA